MFIDLKERRGGRKGGGWREREREREIDLLLSIRIPTRYPAGNLGVFPDWESNLQPSGVQDDAPIN